MEYQPGSLELAHDNYFSFDRKYRIVYYTIDGCFFDLLTDAQWDDFGEWLEEEGEKTDHGATRNEMLLVSMVKRYNIPREEFDKAVENFVSFFNSMGWDMSHEASEVPNADVIYTFDNELINRYYRYE